MAKQYFINPFTNKMDAYGDDDISIDTIQFDIDLDTPDHSEGLLYWDSEDKTLSMMTEAAGTALQIGQEMFLRATNKTGGTLTNGQVVYIDGAQGNRPTVALADADIGVAAGRTIGVITNDIENNRTGYVTTFGLVRDVDTGSFAEGDPLYVSSTAGAFTDTYPTYPQHIMRVGYVVTSHATEGVILVSTQKGQHLENLYEVDITSEATGDFLRYNGAGQWVNSGDAVMGSDSDKFYFGAGNDFSIVYDGTDAILKTDEVAASDLVVTCGAAKTLELSTVVWDDQQVVLRTVGFGASAPSWTAYKSSEVLAFNKAQDNQIFFSAQMSHRYKTGSTVEFHIHSTVPDNNSGVVRWIFTYSWADIGDTFPAASTITSEQTISANSLDEHLYFDLDDLTGSADGVSSLLLCSLTREGTHVNDTYNNDIYITALDFHIQIDTLGSRQETVK